MNWIVNPKYIVSISEKVIVQFNGKSHQQHLLIPLMLEPAPQLMQLLVLISFLFQT